MFYLSVSTKKNFILLLLYIAHLLIYVALKWNDTQQFIHNMIYIIHMKNMINNELYYSFKLILNLTFYSEELLKWIFKILAGLFNTHSVKGFTSDPVSLKNSQKYWVGDSDYSPLPSNPLWKKKVFVNSTL